MKVKYTEIKTENAPAAVGPYSQGVALTGSQNLIFVSGQLPIDPATGEIVVGDIKILTTRVIDNIEAILKASKSGLDSVVRVEVFLENLDDFNAMNEVYSERFITDPQPARQTVQVARLPKGSPIEMSCIAFS